MSELEGTGATGGVSRRTVAKAMAWSVPAIAVAAAVPLASASAPPPPPPPNIDFSIACGNTGSTGKGCGGFKTLQVALTLTNQTGRDVVFQITGMWTCNCATAPTAPGTGVAVGVRGIWKTPNFTTHNNCSPSSPPTSTCEGGTPNGTVLVPDGTSAQKYWIESTSLGDSSTFSSTIAWRMLDAGTCAVLFSNQAQTANAISPQNC